MHLPKAHGIGSHKRRKSRGKSARHMQPLRFRRECPIAVDHGMEHREIGILDEKLRIDLRRKQVMLGDWQWPFGIGAGDEQVIRSYPPVIQPVAGLAAY